MSLQNELKPQNTIKPQCKLTEQNGNIYNLISIASRALKDNNQPEQAEEMFNRITTTAHSYEEAIGIIMDYVVVV